MGHHNATRTIRIALITALLVLGLFTAITISTFASVARSTAQITSEIQPTASLAQEVAPQPETPIESAPAPEALSEAPIASQRVSEPAPAPVTPPAPVAVRYAAEMTTAFIAPSDHFYAAQLLLTDTGWVQPGNSLGVTMAASEIEPVERFAVAHRYVMHHYGSWAAAYENTQLYGGRW